MRSSSANTKFLLNSVNRLSIINKIIYKYSQSVKFKTATKFSKTSVRT